ncbi:hypothetical protein Hanom_Chr04g00349881 [Helianthus anomalus]
MIVKSTSSEPVQFIFGSSLVTKHIINANLGLHSLKRNIVRKKIIIISFKSTW